ncbi:MAG: hypothetical protein ACYCZB_08215 [Acidiphilium sp.]
MRLLFSLFDGATLRRLALRLAFAFVGLGALLIGIGFLVVAAYQAVAAALDPLDASLIFGALFVFAALAFFAVANFVWSHRPRPALARARYGLAAETLALVRLLAGKRPVGTVAAALALGALVEFLRKRDAGDKN